MKEKYLSRPTTYVVRFWDEDGAECIKEEIYPMHLYSLSEVIFLLKGRESNCDIYESRYEKNLEKYITNGVTIVYVGYVWVMQR